MGTVHPIFRQVGRLHDSLLHIVERIQAAMGDRARTVSADAKGNLFISDFNAHADGLDAGRQTIGTYNMATPLTAIERDLRLALRERARAWILDWDVTARNPRDHFNRIPRKRRARAARMKNAGSIPPNTTGAPS
jgi:hypothetical protein